MSESESFGSILREYRRKANVSQRDLASKVGLDFSYISKLENDRLPPPSADTIIEICGVLEIDPSELLALAGKLPTQVQKNIGSNETAQQFLWQAQQMSLTDDEWQHMINSLRKLRDDNA